ncbi:hypothetical protein GCM10027398_28430 [Azotobacter salinestris]
MQKGDDSRSVTVEGATYGTSKEALASVERQQGGKPNARYSVQIGGEHVTNKKGIEAAKPSDKTAGAKGLSHIIEARQRKDGKSAEGALRLLDGMVEAISKGGRVQPDSSRQDYPWGEEHDDMIVWMTKREGSNAWVVTGYEKRPDGRAAGRATGRPTHAAASRTRDDVGAGNSNNGRDNGQINRSLTEAPVNPDDTRYSVRPSKAFSASRGLWRRMWLRCWGMPIPLTP